jgi:hypothetical protein
MLKIGITLYYCTTVLLYYCTTVLLYYCTTVLLYYCTTVLLYYGITVLLYYCTTVLLYYCTTVLLYYCTTVLLYYCTTVLYYKTISIIYVLLRTISCGIESYRIVAAYKHWSRETYPLCASTHERKLVQNILFHACFMWHNYSVNYSLPVCYIVTDIVGSRMILWLAQFHSRLPTNCLVTRLK